MPNKIIRGKIEAVHIKESERSADVEVKDEDFSDFEFWDKQLSEKDVGKSIKITIEW